MTNLQIEEVPQDEEAASGTDDALSKRPGTSETGAVNQQPSRTLSPQPMFQTLFAQSVDARDTVLADFADHVVGPLSDLFGMEVAQGSAFFNQHQAEKGTHTEHISHDQPLRAHVITGMLSARRIANLLKNWHARPMDDWDETTERLFIAGYLLYEFTKIRAARETLKASGFTEREAPSAEQFPTLEHIFLGWGQSLGLDTFLAPVGGLTMLLHDTMGVACSTPHKWGTIPIQFPRTVTTARQRLLTAQVSALADLLADAQTPRDLAANESIGRALNRLSINPSRPHPTARLVFHHVAENRGVLLNFIHGAVLAALEVDDQRVALLYAPTGVAYLERHSAPPLPSPAMLADQIVSQVRAEAGSALRRSGKGAKAGNTGLQIDSSYNDFFDVRQMLTVGVALVGRHLRNNKSIQRLHHVREENWAADKRFPPIPTASRDARLDQIAEWAGLVENQFRDRFPGFDLTSVLLQALEVGDLQAGFNQVRQHPKAVKGGGIKFWWYYAAAHALARKPGLHDSPAVLEWLDGLAQSLALMMPDPLPPTAQANAEAWHSLRDYVIRVLIIGAASSAALDTGRELERYIRAKARHGGAVCAICGGADRTRRPSETAVSFQPGVYSARIRIGDPDNKRHLCTICALEQLLRQLFVEHLDSGSTAEKQRIRYLSLYPSTFFTPETLHMTRRAYNTIQSVRLSDRDLRRALNTQALPDPGGRDIHPLTDAGFWQRLEPFVLRRQDEEDTQRIVRYGEAAQSMILVAGFRSFDDPSDTESWLLPAFFALLLPICLDVKVVVSESSVPPIPDSVAAPTMVWLDGAPASIQALAGDSRLALPQVQTALARLTAAALIHLDLEYTPPREHWQRLSPTVHALLESPLYVFHCLKKQEEDHRPVNADQIRRYMAYADTLFDPQRDPLLFHTRSLVNLYRRFYQATSLSNPYSLLRPLNVVADALSAAAPHPLSGAQPPFEAAWDALSGFMGRVERGLGEGRVPKGTTVGQRDAAMRAFCRGFVNDVFIGLFQEDTAALRGKPLTLVRSACEFLYRDMQRAVIEERMQYNRTDEAHPPA